MVKIAVGLKKIGAMRCPLGAVVTQVSDGEFAVNSDKRCPGIGPVFEDPARKKILILHCPEGKKDEAKWTESRESPTKRKELLQNKPTHDCEAVDMRREIWESEVKVT